MLLILVDTTVAGPGYTTVTVSLLTCMAMCTDRSVAILLYWVVNKNLRTVCCYHFRQNSINASSKNIWNDLLQRKDFAKLPHNFPNK